MSGISRSWPLRAVSARERSVSCGCRVMVAVERSIDVGLEGAEYVLSPPTLTVVPCERAEHVALARALVAEGGLSGPDELAEAMEEALA